MAVALVAAATALGPHGAVAQAPAPPDAGTAAATDAPPVDPKRLSGRDIYARVLENRFQTFVQHVRVVSSDRGGREQASELDMWFMSFRDARGAPRSGTLLSKSRVQYTAPFDIRHSGYLVIHHLERPDDQFVYRSSERKVRRVSLRGESVFGSDFSLEDVIPRELEDARYERLEDTEHAGRPCFWVRAVPIDPDTSAYSRFDIKVDRERFVPLHTLYWDDRGIAIKALSADVDSVEQIRGVWIVKRSRMVNLLTESSTRLEVVEIQPNVHIDRAQFDLRKLASSH
jgi:hypothetical protein